MTKYFIYCRKSTEEEERQILSIEAQLQELRDFAKQNNLFIVREYAESKTAKEPGRPIFNEMLGEIEKGNASGILAWNPDRLARNSVDGGKIIYSVDTGKIKSLKFPTFWFEATPQGKFMLSVAFGQAKYYTDNLRENILRGIRQKLRRGEMPSKAPLGYFNEPRLRTIEPDIKTYPKVKKILELFASGNYTLSTIQTKNLVLQENFLELKNFLKKIGSNRQIINQKLVIDFVKPWSLLCKTTAEARRAEADNINNNSINSIWWSVLDDARTYFQHNPDTN